MSDLHDVPFTPEITASDEVYRGAVWTIRRETFDLPEATGLVRDLMAHTGAVAVACLNEAGGILLVQQYRHPVRARLWEVPAGLLDIPGEDPLTAAKRELAEEADLTAARWEVLSDSALSPGGAARRSGSTSPVTSPRCPPPTSMPAATRRPGSSTGG